MSTSLHDSLHTIDVTNPDGYNHTRNVNISVGDCAEHKSLLVKIKDPDDFSLNFTQNIDKKVFGVMRKEQSLDVDFDEFKSNLIEMLHQIRQEEIFSRLEVDSNNKAKLIFYGKSRIKSLIYLIIDLEATNQREIFDEMSRNLNNLQQINKSLEFQSKSSRKLLQVKENQLITLINEKKQLHLNFREKIESIGDVFESQIDRVTSILLSRVLNLSQRVDGLIGNVESVKRDHDLKLELHCDLQKKNDHLRSESMKQSEMIESLRNDNEMLRSLNETNEHRIVDLNRNLSDRSRIIDDLKSRLDEVETDARQAALIIAQKTSAHDDLAKDLVQANQMLVNFNHLYDKKNDELDQLRHSLSVKDEIVRELSRGLDDLKDQFEQYKIAFNGEEMSKLNRELTLANKRIEDVEKVNRETMKLNELLTRKLASGDFTQRQFVHQGFNHN